MPIKLVALDFLELEETDKEKLRSLGHVTLYDEPPDGEAETIARIGDAELVITNITPISAKTIQQASALKYIVVSGVGCDHVDLQAATDASIPVVNCPTYNSRAVAEYTIGLIFAVMRRVVEAHHQLQAGIWQPRSLSGFELQGKHLVLVGHGHIGRAVEKLAIALGMQVSYTDSKTSETDLDCLIAAADILSLHLPLTPKTRHLLNVQRLARMKPSAYLINTSRGAIVDTDALLMILQDHRIAGAALDVFADEPIDGAIPDQILELTRLDQVVTTPHMAYNTREASQRLGKELLETVQSCMAGQPIHAVR